MCKYILNLFVLFLLVYSNIFALSKDEIILIDDEVLVDRYGAPVTGNIDYFDSSNNKTHSVSIKNGRINGKTIYYYGDGSVQYEVPFIKNVINGDIIEYYESGSIKSIFPHRDGLANGLYKEMDLSGNTVRSAEFSLGALNGYDRRYNNGTIWLEVEYKNDIAIKGICIKNRKKTNITSKELEMLNLGELPKCDK